MTLFIGIFTPILSFKINSSGMLDMLMESLIFGGLSEFKDISMTYSPISMMTGKPIIVTGQYMPIVTGKQIGRAHV